ncbi:MAG: histidine phosphatase family protein [Treponema sp.]|jgi:probable phosphoglycerate mutase|nr:histidine phosphatase family protein [Treponema sp.]
MKKTWRGMCAAWMAMALLVSVGTLSAAANAENAAAKGDGDGSGVVTVYVTRHGRTLFNTMDRAQGWADTPLTQEGIAVAEDLGRGLRDVRFHAVISSDLTRARQTARLVMAQNKASSGYLLDESAMLREACYGSFEGDFNTNMITAMAEAGGYADAASFMAESGPLMWYNSANYAKQLDTSGMAEDGETIKTRMQSKLREVAEAQAQRGGGTVLLVAHGMSINIMLSDLDAAFNYTGTALANASVCKLVYKDGAFTIESFNDVSYIEAGKQLR